MTSGKKAPPLIKNMINQATTDPQQIKTWWTTWPQANIGLIPGPEYLVLDIDSGKHPQAASSIQKMGLSVPGRAVRTVSGGYHFYFKHPGGGCIGKDDKGKWSGEFPGIDIIADAAYVVAEGSVIQGKRYEYIGGGINYPQLPVFLIAKLPYKTRYTRPAAPELSGKPRDYNTLPDSIPIGERDVYFWGLSCSLAVKSIDIGSARQVIAQHFARCAQAASQPFTIHKALGKLERAYSQYGPGVISVTLPVQNVDGPQGLAAGLQPAHTGSVLSDALSRYVLISDTNEVYDLKAHPRCSLLKLDNWKNTHKNKKVVNGASVVQLSGLWVAHAQRQTAYSTIYYPSESKFYSIGAHLHINCYISPDLVPALVGDRAEISLVLGHIRYLLQSSDASGRFLDWMAFTVRYPAIRIPWAPVLISPYQGTGKSWLFSLFKLLLGAENCYRIDPSDLAEARSNFNEWWGGTLLWIDELSPKYQFYEKMKALITETSGLINYKYGKKEHRKIFCNVICTSNHTNALKIDERDRRLWINKSEAEPKDDSYYDALFGWLKTNGPAHFLRFLLNRDLSSFKWSRPPPVTRAKNDMITAGTTEAEIAVRDAYDLGQGPLVYDMVTPSEVVLWLRNKGLEIDERAKLSISRSLNRLCPEQLPQGAYRVEAPGVERRRLRLILIRNGKYWAAAGREEVITYYLRRLIK